MKTMDSLPRTTHIRIHSQIIPTKQNDSVHGPQTLDKNLNGNWLTSLVEGGGAFSPDPVGLHGLLTTFPILLTWISKQFQGCLEPTWREITALVELCRKKKATTSLGAAPWLLAEGSDLARMPAWHPKGLLNSVCVTVLTVNPRLPWWYLSCQFNLSPVPSLWPWDSWALPWVT